MSEQLAHYIPSAEMVVTIEAVMAQRQAIRADRFKFAVRFGTEIILLTDDKERMIGLLFYDPCKVPAGWLKSKRNANAYYPSKKTKALKEVRREMELLSFPSFGVGSTHFTGSSIFFVSVYKVGDTWIVRQHMKANPPKDARLLKLSEYYAMKEAAECMKKTA